MKALQSLPCDQAFHLKNLAQGLVMGRISPHILHCYHSSFDSPFRISECWYKWLLLLANNT